MNVELGDFVVDPMDGEIREIVEIIDDTLYMADGGVMGRNEVSEVLLESEVRP